VFKHKRVVSVLTLLSPGERQRSTTLRVGIRTTDRMLLQPIFKITSTSDVERIVSATKNVDPRHLVIMLIGLEVRKSSGRRLRITQTIRAC
jgi:hypothetical protein